MPEYPPARSQEEGAQFKKRTALRTQAALMTYIRSKNMLSPLSMPCHYYTTESSNFCSHYQLCNFFYMLSSNYLEEKIGSMRLGIMISTEVFFPITLPPQSTVQLTGVLCGPD